jgi:hypothetical protein
VPEASERRNSARQLAIVSSGATMHASGGKLSYIGGSVCQEAVHDGPVKAWSRTWARHVCDDMRWAATNGARRSGRPACVSAACGTGHGAHECHTPVLGRGARTSSRRPASACMYGSVRRRSRRGAPG